MASFNPRTSKFTAEDMSVKEAEYVENTFGTDPNQFCIIKNYIWGSVVKDAVEAGREQAMVEAKEQITGQIRAELAEKVMPGLLLEAEKKGLESATEKAKKELEPKLRKEFSDSSKKEFLESFLVDADKKAYSTTLRDLELECTVSATAASKLSDTIALQQQSKKRALSSLCLLALVGAGPYALWVWNNSSSEFHIPFYAFPYLVVFLYTLFAGVFSELPQSVKDNQLYAARYLALASGARTLKNLHLTTKTRAEVLREFEFIERNKSEYDNNFRPSIEFVESVKPVVRERLSVEMDPEQLYIDEFEQRVRSSAKA